jgi:hypothetical protein
VEKGVGWGKHRVAEVRRRRKEVHLAVEETCLGEEYQALKLELEPQVLRMLAAEHHTRPPYLNPQQPELQTWCRSHPSKLYVLLVEP